MSDIEVLRKLTKIFNELKKDDEEGHSSAYELQWEDIYTIENLIKEYKELKEKISKYENQLDLDYVEENYIPKSKVKEKIVDYDKMIKATYGDITYQGDYRRKVCFEIRQILQELLKGE